MPNNKIKIYNNNKQVNSIIIKANSYLINTYKTKFNVLETSTERFELLKDLWKKEFNAVIYETHVEFDNEHQKIMFTIKFNF